MDLPNLFSSGSKKSTEVQILFQIISDSQVQVFLLELSKSGVEIKEKSTALSYEGLENCVIETDKALQQLSKESESVTEVIFSVNASWVKDGEIIAEKKPFIKKITDDLSLKPLGFIDNNEALAEQKVVENALYSGIIVYVTESDLSFTLIYQGKIKKTEVVGSSTDFIADFREGLARIQKILQSQGNYLPQKVHLAAFDVSQKELKEKQQELYDVGWNDHSGFLQPPTIEIISVLDFETLLSKEAGKNAAAQKGLTDIALAATIPSKASAHETAPAKSGESAEKSQLSSQEVAELDSEEFGFSDPLKGEESSEVPTSFGIPIKTKEFDTKALEEADNLRQADLKSLSKTDTETAVESNDKQLKKPHPLAHKKNIKWFAILGFILGLFVLMGGIVFGAQFVASTEVEVTLNKKPISKDITLQLDTSLKETDVESLTIAADTVQKTVSARATMQTTGLKVVGEEAKGRVVIYNKTDAVKKFEKGTVLKSGELSFTIDDEVTIASASAKQGGEDYGSTEVTVTAQQIGAESNLSKDTELTVSSYDKNTYNAYVDEALTGGSSREVRVVAEADRTELLTDLRGELLEEANSQFADESGDGVYILPSKSIVSEDATFDAEVESEANELTLELEITVEAVSYSGGDLKPVAAEILKQEIPDNYELADEDPQILSSPSQTDLDKLESGAVVSLEANISSYAIPQLSEDEIRQQIVGKQFSEAESLLTQQEEISKVSFSVTPSFLSTFVSKVAAAVDRITVRFTQ